MTRPGTCYVCDQHLTRTDAKQRCPSCDAAFHRECLDRVEGPECPNCHGEAWIAAMEM